MTCNSCHTVLSANDKFCSQCGSRVAEGHELAATATSYVSGALASVESAVAEFHDGAALVRSSEWECVARTKPRVGPVPKLVVCTPFRNLLAVALKRRAEYDDFDLEEEIKQLVPGVMVHAFFFDKDRVDVGSWKLVLTLMESESSRPKNRTTLTLKIETANVTLALFGLLFS